MMWCGVGGRILAAVALEDVGSNPISAAFL